jgi:hypothetical protein
MTIYTRAQEDRTSLCLSDSTLTPTLCDLSLLTFLTYTKHHRKQFLSLNHTGCIKQKCIEDHVLFPNNYLSIAKLIETGSRLENQAVSLFLFFWVVQLYHMLRTCLCYTILWMQVQYDADLGPCYCFVMLAG